MGKSLQKSINILVICLVYNSGSAQDTTRYQQIYQALVSPLEREVLMARVADLTINRAEADFKLFEGDIYLLAPVEDRRVAMLFTGKGTFNFSPLTAIEKNQLRRFYEEDTLETEFTCLYMLFCDSTFTQLNREVTFEAVDNPPDLENEIEDILEYISDKNTKYFRSDMMKFLLDSTEDTGFFYAHFYRDQARPFMFEINPYEAEDIRFMHRAELGHIYKVPEVICQYPGGADYDKDFSELIDIRQFTIDLIINDDLEIKGAAGLNIIVQQAKQRWFAFNIYAKMEIDSVINQNGDSLDFFKAEDAMVFWLDSERYWQVGDTIELKIYYHSNELLERDSRSWLYLKSPLYWYPRYAIWAPAEYELSFTYPADMTLISVGTKIDSQQTGDSKSVTWRSEMPHTHAIFNIGFFEPLVITSDSLPQVTILKTEHGVVFRSADIEEQIASDIGQSLEFYSRIYGPPPFDRLYVSEIPFWHGTAYRGLINLSWTTFHRTEARGYDEIFRAHEVAHQWFGIEVGFTTYHDQWLSESFAEFSALWYLQEVSDDMDRFYDILEDMHKNIFTNREYLFSKDQESGPIWLGSRTSSSLTQGDYGLVVYEKGAYVLYMLRMMMYDWENSSDQKFIDMMQDYLTSFSRKKARTRDFIAIVEKHLGTKADWFFNQWLFGTDLPEYVFAYQVGKNESDTYALNVKAKQVNETGPFRMPVPIEVVYDEYQSQFFCIWVTAETNEQTFELIAEPVEIIFNTRKSVLAESDEVDYEDL